MPWYGLAVLVSVAISEFTRPLPDEPPKPGLEDLRRNKSSQARRIPVVWGKPINSVANLAWFGDLRTVPITREIKGLFKSDTVITGYSYYVSQHLILSAGAKEGRILKIWCNDKLAYPVANQINAGTSLTGFPGYNPDGSQKLSGAVVIALPELFGGEEKQGGIIGTFRFYVGHPGQGQNAYLKTMLEKKDLKLPEFNKVAHIVWEGGVLDGDFQNGYIGNTGQLPQWTFQQERIPKNLPDGNGYISALHAKIEGEANPAEMLYEILIDKDWGMGIDPEFLINTQFFQRAAKRFFDDSMGMSVLWDQGKSLASVIKEILRHVDAALYVNSINGKFELKPIRETPKEDYPSLKVFNKSNCKLQSFSRPNLDELANEVKVIWSDIKNKKDKVHIVQDSGNYQAQDKQIISTEVRYPGFTRLSLVRRVAVRDLKRGSYPLARASLENVSRDAYSLTPGDKIVINFPEHDINNLLMIVNEIDYGDYKDRKISIECLQDVSLIPDYDGEEDDSSLWEPTGTSAEPISTYQLVSRPYWLNTLDPKQKKPKQFKPMFLVEDPTESSLGFKLWKSQGVNGAAPPTTLLKEDGIKSFAPAGVLLQDIKRSEAVDTQGLILRLTTAPMNGTQAALSSVDDDEIQIDGKNLIMIGNEIMAVKTVEYLSESRAYDGSYGRFIRVTEVWRALLDSVQPVIHKAGEPVWFISMNYATTNKPSFPDSTTSLRLKFLTQTAEDALKKEDAEAVVMYNTKRAKRPYPVKDVYVNGTRSPVIINGEDAVIAWAWDNRIAAKDDQGNATEDDELMARKWDSVSITPEATSTLKIELYDSHDVLKYAHTAASPATTHTIPWAEIADADDLFGSLEIRLTAHAGSPGLDAPFTDSIRFRKSFPTSVNSGLDKLIYESATTYWAMEE